MAHGGDLDNCEIGSGSDDADVKTKASGSGRLIVAGIDIGTTFSGWAYSMNHDPESVHANATWYCGDNQLASLKVQ